MVSLPIATCRSRRFDMRKAVLVVLMVLLHFFVGGVTHVLAQRIVVLYAAASPVLKALGVEEEVVGVTRKDHTFPHAVKVGSHLRPNIELIKALKPDLIIAGSRRAFPEALRQKVQARVFYYDPRTLAEILKTIEDLGQILAREKEAQALVAQLEKKLAQVEAISCRPRVVYEIMERPLKVAGQKNIVTDIIRVAGGVNPVKVAKKHVLISPEEILLLKPDLYLYQVGPMNKNPTPPKKRAYFKGLRAQTIKVNEFEFARPGLNAFEAVIHLNGILKRFCATKTRRRS